MKLDLAFARFLITGLFNTAITYVLYLLFLQFMAYQLAYSVVFVLGILISYVLNAGFVFRARMTLGTLARFPLVYVAQYALGMGLVVVLVEFAGVAAWLAPLCAIAVTVPLTFVLSRFIFTKHKKTEVTDAHQQLPHH